MKRRLSNFAAAISLMLFLACLFMWVRSGLFSDAVGWQNGHGYSWSCRSLRDNVTLSATEQMPPQIPPGARVFWTQGTRGFFYRSFALEPRLRKWTWPSYSSRQPQPNGNVQTSWLLPCWLLTLNTGILPALWFWQRRKEKKAARSRGFEVLPAPAAKTAP